MLSGEYAFEESLSVQAHSQKLCGCHADHKGLYGWNLSILYGYGKSAVLK